MTRSRKLAIAGATLFGLLFLALLTIPVLLRGRVAERARTEINAVLDARVDWAGIGLTFFRDFPNLTLGLREPSVVGIGRFEGDTLLSADRFRLVLDGASVLRSVFGDAPIVVRSIRFDRPVVSLAVLEDGTANWDIVRPRSEDAPEVQAAGGRALNIELRSVEVAEGRIAFENASAGLHASLEGFDHSLSGNFSRDSLGVRTRTHADSVTVRFGGTPWLADASLDFEANVDADLANRRYAFRENELRLNALVLRFSGEAAQADDGLALDVTFGAPGTDFGQVLSLVPALYAREFSSLETTGNVAIEGRVQGTYTENTLPAFSIGLTVDEGSFRYPDLPLPARAIAVDLAIDNPGGDADSTVVQLRRFHAEVGGRPLDASFTLRTPVSDPWVDARVNGVLDLADVARTVKLQKVQELTGVISADARLTARRSDIDSARFERVAADGTLSVRDVTVAAEGLRQPVAIEQAMVRLSPQRSELETFRATIGSSDVQAGGSVENLLGFLLWDQPLRGNATLTSRQFVLDEWRSDEPDREVIPVPPRLDLALNATIERLTFGTLEMAMARGSVRVKDQRLTLDNFTVETLGGRIGMSGFYETVDSVRPRFAIDLAIDSLDIRSAAESLLTVRTLAPVARYARGTFSADLDLNGALASDLTPLFDVLDGSGSLLTSRIALEGFPLMERVAEALKVPRLTNPTLNAIRSSIAIRDGRLHVRPVAVGIGDFQMLVSGSNGIDQSLDYTLDLAMPRGVLGDAANRAIQDLAQRVGRAGFDIAAVDSIHVGVRVTGSITDPNLDIGIGDAVTSLAEQARQAAGEAVEQRVDEARERLDSARAAASQRARARADSIIMQAEERADSIRVEAARLAETVRAEGNRRADDLLARATSELARRAAQPAAERIRREADDQANTLVREADQRADALVEEARRRADELVRTDTLRI